MFNGQGTGGEGRSGLLQLDMSEAFGLLVTEDHYYSPEPIHTQQGAKRRYSSTYLSLCFTYDRIIDILLYPIESCTFMCRMHSNGQRRRYMYAKMLQHCYMAVYVNERDTIVIRSY